MAIIRIKRTTGTVLPVGLTFGELAFIGSTGGAIANRLYINDAQGNMRWIGAEILNSPAFWTGSTAETTIPTVSAVNTFINSFFGTGLTFSDGITANLSDTKSFGKYRNGQYVPAKGKTAVEVILDALIESILPTSFLATRAGYGDPTITYGAIPFGATAIRIGLTFGYTVNTPGATAIGATLQFSRGGDAFATVPNPPPLYATSLPFFSQIDGPTRGAYLHSFTQSPYDTRPVTYRYTILDNSGAGATYAESTVNFTPYSTSVLGGDIGVHTDQSGDSLILRERGNTGSTLSITLTNSNDSRWVNQTAYLLQYQVNNGTWYNALNNIANDVTYTNVASTRQISATIPVKPVVGGIYVMSFRGYYKDTVYPGGVAATIGIPSINFVKKIFYGATTGSFFTNPNPTFPRSLPLSTQSSTNSPGYSNIPGSNPLTFTFNTSTNSSYTTYVIALPKGLTLNDALQSGGPGVVLSTGETIAGKANPTADPCQLRLGLTQANDFSGVPHDYNIYSWSVGEQYANGTTVTVRCNGTVTQ